VNRQLRDVIENAKIIVIIQADNPDADSLGSALALETILHEMGKLPLLYCGVPMPTYLQYLPGWDRVSDDLPDQFDASIIVDASTMTLLDKLESTHKMPKLANRPCLVLDHHTITDNPIPFATLVINEPISSTGELLYTLAKDQQWPLPIAALNAMLAAILGDTQGLSNPLATPETYRIAADIIEAGVDRAGLEDSRREQSKMPLVILRYKAELLKRSEFFDNGKIALVVIPQSEIYEYSPLYNPAPLIQGDLLMTEGVAVSIVLKQYDNGKITAAIRSNSSAPISGALAKHFDGGGHTFASGFKLTDNRSIESVKTDVIATASKLLREENNETV
jgi:phosphoesterase RecJ-like protein